MALIQIIQMSWLLSDGYVGASIWALLAFLAIWVGFQWGILSIFIDRSPWIVAGFWAVTEWSRMFIYCGYAFNPVGLSLTATNYGSQILSLVGVYGLSFLVIVTNLLFYHRRAMALTLALIPYLLGGVIYHIHQHKMKNAQVIEILLVQPVIEPKQVNNVLWEKFCALLAPYFGEHLDLIVFPESILPFIAHEEVFYTSWVDQMFAHFFQGKTSGLTKFKVSNVDIAYALSQLFNADFVIGLEDDNHNAAFCFSQGEKTHYHKQVLLPFGEYIPLGFNLISKHLPPCGTFEKGKQTRLLGKALGISICYEEMFGNLMRKNRLLGAKIMVNISNDIWYPLSRLPMVHYMHGRLRAIEMGLPLVRACNSGVTCGVDATGKMIATLPHEQRKKKAVEGTLKLSLPLYRYPTLYTYVGDYLVLGIAFLLPITALRPLRFKRMRSKFRRV